jgi:alkylhydroperoxidase family enzyme
MARLPYVDPAAAPDGVRSTLEALPAQLNIFRMMAHAQTNLRPLLRLGTSILTQQKLDARLRELAILRVAGLSHAEYEWVQHVPIAKATGATDAQIEALARDDIGAGCFDETDRLLLQFTTEVVRDVRASEATFGEVARRLTPREIVELILAIGFYMTMARLMETTAIDVEAPAGGVVYEHAKKQSESRS